MSILIKNVHCVDPRFKMDSVHDVLIEKGRIKEIGHDISKDAKTVIDAKGLHLVPGLIDVHVHFRQPGQEHKETLATGIQSAINGGFVACVPMPNTAPPCDTSSVVKLILHEADKYKFSLLPCGTMTKGRAGDEMSEMADLKQAGAVAMSDDGGGVMNALLMRRIMEYASMLDLPLMIHAEDSTLSKHGVMHESAASTQFGLVGIPSLAEYGMIMRDIELSRLTGAHVHFQHISAKESVRCIRRAKHDGLHVTCEVTPHHLLYTDEKMSGYDTNYKMNPPLRSEADRLALIEGIKDGTIDMIATDHAPHHAVEKEQDMVHAPFGCIGLETSFGVVLKTLLHTGVIDMSRLVSLMNVAPAALVGQPDLGGIAVGAEANLALVDLSCEWVVDAKLFKSKARNCPFNGESFKGRAVKTICKGMVYDNVL